MSFPPVASAPLRPRCCSTFLTLIVPVLAPADCSAIRASHRSSIPIIQHVWGFVVDQTLTPTQSLHYSQWRNSYSTHSFDYHPLVLAPNPLNSQKAEPSLGSIFLLNYTNTLSPHLVMTAGFGWIGEINNQFNITKGYTTSTVANENIPPNITFGPNSNQCNNNTYTCWGTSGSWFQSINRKLGISIVNNWLWSKGRNTFNIGGEYRRAYQDDNEEQTEGGHFNFSPGADVHNSVRPQLRQRRQRLCQLPARACLTPPTAATRRNWSCATWLCRPTSRTTSRSLPSSR